MSLQQLFLVCITAGYANALHTKVNLFYLDLYTEKPLITAHLADYKCTSLPKWATNKAFSAVNKRCVMLYSHPNCEGESYELPPSPLQGNTTRFTHHFILKADSLRLCKKHEEGRSNNWKDNDADQQNYDDLPMNKIEIYASSSHRDLLLDTVITPYCTTLPEWDFNKASSIKSEVCVMLYSDPHCKGSSFEVNDNSTFLSHFNDKTQSFRPCTKESILGEPKLTFEVTRFEYFKVLVDDSKMRVREFTKKTVLTNNGTASLKQPYEVSWEDKQKTAMSWGQMASSAYEVSVSSTVEVETTAQIPLVGQSTITASLTAGYAHTETKETSKGIEKVTQEKKMIKLSEEITLPACTIYEIRSFAKIVRGYPVKFLSEMEVTGIQGERPMTADQVKSMLSKKVTFIRDKDENTIIAQGKGMLVTDFKIDSGIHANGRKIPVVHCPRE